MFIDMNDAFWPLNETDRRKPSAFAPAVARTVRVLDALAASGAPLGVSEIARRVGMGKSSVHGIVMALVDERLLAEDGDSKRYVLGPHLAALGQSAAGALHLEAVREALSPIVAGTYFTAFFGHVEKGRVRIVAREDGTGELRLSAPVGSLVPLWAGALGKAWLSEQPEATWASHIRMLRDSLSYGEMARIQDEAMVNGAKWTMIHGYALDRGEYLEGVFAVAAAVQGTRGNHILWVVGMDEAVDDNVLAHLGESLVGAALTVFPANFGSADMADAMEVSA
jgi:DNA-binding IclR family transcriptional regulator